METVWKPLARMLAFSRAIGKLLLPGRRPVSFLLEHDRGSEDHYRHLTGEQAGQPRPTRERMAPRSTVEAASSTADMATRSSCRPRRQRYRNLLSSTRDYAQHRGRSSEPEECGVAEEESG